MKTIAATAFALVLSTSFALAQERQVQSETHRGGTSSSTGEKPGLSSGVIDPHSGINNSQRTEPGDFALTGGGSRTGNPTGQVEPGTSNAPAGNSGGE